MEGKGVSVMREGRDGSGRFIRGKEEEGGKGSGW